MAVEFVPICVNPHTRPSRLMRSIPHYLVNSAVTMARLLEDAGLRSSLRRPGFGRAAEQHGIELRGVWSPCSGSGPHRDSSTTNAVAFMDSAGVFPVALSSASHCPDVC